MFINMFIPKYFMFISVTALHPYINYATICMKVIGKAGCVYHLFLTKEVVAMTTYEMLSLMIAFGMLVVAIVNKNNDRKK